MDARDRLPPEPSPEPRLPRASPLKGRGTAWLIEHRFKPEHAERFDDGWGTLDQDASEERLAPDTTVVEERVNSIVSSNDSPDLAFDLSVNPYRGCEHGCVYCFARPTHSYLNLSPGLDFETRIIAKVNAAERLREAFMKPSYVAKHLNVGSATDAYQPVERRLGITRSVIEVLAECSHPFSLVTKSSGIERDLDLIAPMAARKLAAVYVSLTSLDPALARILEPRAAAPHRRLRTIEALARAGIPVGVSVSPIIPFINEPEIERLLEAAASAGARAAFGIVLRLPWEVNPIFQRWLDEHFPDRAARVMARVREMRGGKDYDARWGKRMKGEGVWAELLQQRLKKAIARNRLDSSRIELDVTQFRRPTRAAPAGKAGAQQDLFG
ncbi:PA0069 family radical SAM protein [Piscinibacter koreensis]|uniref:PA0069 family radical SAM protein n=1 Tax=Piscinibacter koreensis TaxID=2742824 RepID=A0A7Y6NS37_9BURK|nr:PA0069 family radical SAM protein [Schlegelella koreensis]NUZ08318.1 PA0069 family radical SAM protein [Schlegelella koreensis]